MFYECCNFGMLWLRIRMDTLRSGVFAFNRGFTPADERGFFSTIINNELDDKSHLQYYKVVCHAL